LHASAIVLGICAPVAAQVEIDTGRLVPNLPALAAVQSGSTIYLGGRFTSFTTATGDAALLDAVTGAPVPAAVIVPDRLGVSAVASDGAGGWYAGGDFLQIAGQDRKYLAHIRADGSVGSWRPDVPAFIYELAVRDGVVYAGNDTKLWALDASTGTTIWAASVGACNDIEVGDDVVYAACTRGVNAVDRVTGQVTSWDPRSSREVTAVVCTPAGVWVAGKFTSIGLFPRNGLAILDPKTAISAPARSRRWPARPGPRRRR
jgi:outer membrane protein assembly factor BamB